MPRFDDGETSIYYEEYGRGFPLLLIAPGAMNSTVEMWASAAINPLALYGEDFRLIAMDQRNAGRSTGPLDVADPWGSFASDQLALLDHLGVGAFHVMGCCIGGSFILKLIERAPARVAAAVLEQPIGIVNDNGPLFEAMWRAWGAHLAAERPDIDAETVVEFGTRMWAGDFVISVGRDFVRSCPTPMLVLPGADDYHPAATGREIAALAPRGEVLEPWRDSAEHVEQAVETVRQFLRTHTPKKSASESDSARRLNP
jgi:pimeloyl-ACP methyl ester carboxylesterase